MIETAIWTIYAAVLGLIYIGLSLIVVTRRQGKKLAFGDGGDLNIQLAVRTHGNFAEYVPFAIVLLFGVEFLHWSLWIVHLLGCALVFARLVYAVGLANSVSSPLRPVGAVLTWIVILAESLLILLRAFGIV